jgi:hypothetical protein
MPKNIQKLTDNIPIIKQEIKLEDNNFNNNFNNDDKVYEKPVKKKKFFNFLQSEKIKQD